MKKDISILYVDDEYINLVSFQFLFKEKYTVYIASNYEKAIEIFDKNNIDVIISDYKMPKISGVELLKKIYNTQKKCLRIIHSGFQDDKDIENALNNNIVNYILDKPLKEYELVKLIDEYVSKRDN